MGVIFLSACAPTSTPTPPTGTASPSPQVSLTPSPLPLLASTPTPLPPSQTTLPPTASPTPTLIPLHLCSPLGGYTFAELPGIESQPFIPPRPGKDDGHHGVDFAHWQYKDRVSLEGADVQSVLPGVVAAVVSEKYPYGNMIIVETPYDQLPQTIIAQFTLQPAQSLYLLYAHLKQPSPYTMGASVACGDTIGIVGNTGASGNPHLHLETRSGPAGVTFASMEYYKTTSTEEERANYERWRFLGDFVLYNPWTLLNLGQ